MEKATTGLATPLRDQLDRLAAVEPDDAPVVSLYLDMQADQHGRDNYETFLRKTLAERSRALGGAARKSFDEDAARIREYLEQQLRKSANGLAIFACAARGLFEAVQLDAPLDDHWLFIGPVPHLYPLARLVDQYPKYAALLVNTIPPACSSSASTRPKPNSASPASRPAARRWADGRRRDISATSRTFTFTT
jgi:hypothetical protein